MNKLQETIFEPLPLPDLIKILGLTIKRDEENKVITFLCCLSAYTRNAQFNVSFNAPSSSGKSFIPTEISKLFPKENVIEIAYCSPTAFFHDTGTYDKERNAILIDFTNKILIFLDQPHMDLLSRLRPLLSHDEEEMHLKITDKAQKGGLKTKNVIIKGFPAVIFCSAGLQIDEQEATRFILLSPEINQIKIREAIEAKINKETDYEAYQHDLSENVSRGLLIKRIEAIKSENIEDVVIEDKKILSEKFFSKRHILRPRHQRDISRLIALVKVFALLNCWHRERNGNTLKASNEDILNALIIWDKISESQELNLPSYVHGIYKQVIEPLYGEKGTGLTRQEILTRYFRVTGNVLEEHKFRQQILPMLSAAGLITECNDQKDGRRSLIIPVDPRNSEETRG